MAPSARTTKLAIILDKIAHGGETTKKTTILAKLHQTMGLSDKIISPHPITPPFFPLSLLCRISEFLTRVGKRFSPQRLLTQQ
jgi:hypothetical protein